MCEKFSLLNINNKIILFSLFIFICSINSSNATFKYKLNQKITEDFNITNKLSIPLPKGQWKVIYRSGEHIFRGIHAYTITLAQVSNNNVTKLFSIEKIEGLSAILGYMTPLVVEVVFKPKRHGCVNRNYYTLLKYYKSSGITHNCISIKHIDTNYELYENHDPNRNLGYLVNWKEKNNYNYSDVYLGYDVSIYIPRIADRYLSFSFFESPQNFDNYVPIFSSEEQSEFHPQNINQYKQAKSVMNKWMEYIINYHDSVENGLKIKGKYKIKFDQQASNKTKKGKNNSELVELLEKLDELYRSNVLTKEEFNKAKEKLINQYN